MFLFPSCFLLLLSLTGNCSGPCPEQLLQWSDMLLVQPVEIGHIVKAAFHRDLGHAILASCNELLRPVQPQGGDVIAEASVRHFFKISAEIGGTHKGKRRHLLQGNGIGIVFVDIVQSLFKPPDLLLFLRKELPHT